MDSRPTQISTAELLQDLLATDQEISEFLDELALLAANQIPIALPVLCGITLERDKRIAIAGSSNDEARQMDEIQAGFDQGPCLEAQATGTLMTVTNVENETRWPDYMAAVRDHGQRSVLAVPLDLGATANAAMNFYTTQPGAFDEETIASAEVFATLVAKALRVAIRIAKHEEMSQDRRRAMESRTVIDVAVGITMATAQCNQDEAFTILKNASSHRNVKLWKLAQEMVASIGQPIPSTTFEA